MTDEIKKLLTDTFGEEILIVRNRKRKRRTKEELLEDYKVKCKQCGNEWYHVPNR